MKMSVLVIAATLGAIATPAFANALTDQPRVKAVYDAKRDKYCVSQEITGRRIPVQDCRSKDEWAKVGAIFGQQTDAKKAEDKLAQK